MKVAALTLALASTALGQSLQQVLANNTQLSQLANLAGPFLNSLPTTGAITVLAPNNAAVGAFLSSPGANSTSQDVISALLSYHVLQGNYTTIPNVSFIPTNLQPGAFAGVTGGQRVHAVPNNGSFSLFSGLLQNSTVNGSAIPFNNGVVHVLNQFLTIPQNITTTGVALNLTSAVGAIGQLGLGQTLAGQSDLTYFIPNNAAFERIGGNLANLSSADLTQILQYHVVAAGQPLYSTNLMNGSSVRSLQGGNLTARIVGSDVFINNARVLTANVLVANGVVHVIDRVLNPSNSTISPNTATTAEAFPSATSASNVPFTSGVPTPTSTIATQSAPGPQGSQSSAAGSSSSSGAAWQPAATGAMGMGALFGGAALVMNM